MTLKSMTLRLEWLTAFRFLISIILCLPIILQAQEPASQLNNDPLAERISFRGQWLQGGLIIGKAPYPATISLNGSQITQAKSGVFIIGFDRDAKPKAQVTITWQDEVFKKQFAVQPKDWQIQRIEGIAQSIMNPTKANVTRSGQEAVLVRNARKTLDTNRLDFLVGFQWPLIGPITGDFGRQRVYNGVPGRPHYGVDIAAPTGTPVISPAPGVVTLVHDNMFYSGGTLIIDHGLGLSTTFIHLSEIFVKTGDSIVAGQEVAAVGASGRATGPHLDWRINWLTERLDPSLLVGPMPKP